MSGFQVVMLASGSKGNSALISTGRQQFLIDTGISCRALISRMKEIGTGPEDLDGVFLTHEHLDHVRGLSTFLKKYQVPVYGSMKTWQAILAKDNTIDRRCCRLIDKKMLLGNVCVESFAVPHDAVDPHGYSFTELSLGQKCTYVTDAGFVTEAIRQAVSGSQVLILEANHDIEMLKNGFYPYQLKQRILSTQGHLSNDSAGWLLSQLERLPQHVMLAHLSEQNNKPQLALDTVREILDRQKRLNETELFVAQQDKIVTDGFAYQECIF